MSFEDWTPEDFQNWSPEEIRIGRKLLSKVRAVSRVVDALSKLSADMEDPKAIRRIAAARALREYPPSKKKGEGGSDV